MVPSSFIAAMAALIGSTRSDPLGKMKPKSSVPSFSPTIFSAPSAAQDIGADESPAFRRGPAETPDEPSVALPVQPYDVEHGETHVAEASPAAASAPSPVAESPPVPLGPSLSEQVLDRLRAGSSAPPVSTS